MTIATAMMLVVLLVYAVRLNKVRALWRLPLKNGEDWFLAQRVPAGFYAGPGADLLRRYHLSLFLSFAIDTPVALWLGLTGRYVLLVCAQWLAMVLTVILDNVLIAHFSYRATALCGPEAEPPVTAVHLSLAPRRLRDHTRRWVELLVCGAILVSLAMLARAQLLSAGSAHAHMARVLRSGVAFTAWVLYLQLGLVLLKVVFVRWRLPLPANRTDDFRRWRSAWLEFHLRFFDALRVLFALVPPSALVLLTFRQARPFALGLLGAWVLAILGFTLFLSRERRQLAVVEREVRPVELVKEFPRRPVPKGRFLAGGMLYFDRDNPGVLVRGAHGIALNLAHPSTYAWAAYLIGLVVVMTWMVQATGVGRAADVQRRPPSEVGAVGRLE